MRRIFLLLIILIPVTAFANEIKDNHYKPVWSLGVINNNSTADERYLFKDQQNPFNLYFDTVGKLYVNDFLIETLTHNKPFVNDGHKYAPYETQFFVKYLTTVALAGENSEHGKWCKMNTQKKFCKIFKEYQKEQAEALDMYYGVYKALAKFYGEPFDVDINQYKNCIIAGKCSQANKTFLKYTKSNP